MKEKKKQVFIITSILVMATLLLVGLTYAYYRTRVIGNKAEESISVSSEVLEVTYSDNQSVITADKVGPDYTATKTFSVENTGDGKVNFTIVLDNVKNEFLKQGWEYTLYQIKDGKDEFISSSWINKSEIQSIAPNLSIDIEETQNFKLEIVYMNTQEDQSIDMGASLSLRVNITEVSKWDTALEGTLLYALKNYNVVEGPRTEIGNSISLSYLEETTWNQGKEIDMSTKQNYYCAYANDYSFDTITGLNNFSGIKVGKYIDIYDELINNYILDDCVKTIEEANELKNRNQAGLNLVTNANMASYEISSKGRTIDEVDSAIGVTYDDYGSSYYFRGNVHNNYVNYSGMCWRIVRVQGDGTIKLILDDKDNLCDSEAYLNSYMAMYIDENPIKYTEGESLKFSESNIPSILDNWVYRSDKKLDTTELVENDWCNGVHYEDKNSLKCKVKLGNVRSVVGLLTADEALYAGACENCSEHVNNYLSERGKESFWTMSHYNNEQIYKTDGSSIHSSSIENTNFIRPVVVLNSDVLATYADIVSNGSPGTRNNPYVIGKANSKNVTITYDGNNQSATNVPSSANVAYGSDYTISEQIPTMDAGTFYKWNTSKSCDGTMIEPGSKLSNMVNNVILYACWQMQTG